MKIKNKKHLHFDFVGAFSFHNKYTLNTITCTLNTSSLGTHKTKKSQQEYGF